MSFTKTLFTHYSTIELFNWEIFSYRIGS